MFDLPVMLGTLNFAMARTELMRCHIIDMNRVVTLIKDIDSSGAVLLLMVVDIINVWLTVHYRCMGPAVHDKSARSTLPGLLLPDPPSVQICLHGGMWSGNVFFASTAVTYYLQGTPYRLPSLLKPEIQLTDILYCTAF